LVEEGVETLKATQTKYSAPHNTQHTRIARSKHLNLN